MNKNWMTHDAMWFVNCLNVCGIEKTNVINRAAVKAMAEIEVRRIRKALGLNEFKTFRDVRNLLEGGFEIIKGEFMNFKLSFPRHNTFRWEIPSCFAYEGVKAMGALDDYECGIVDRPNSWFQSLGIDYTCSPDDSKCLMLLTGKCVREYTFTFEK